MFGACDNRCACQAQLLKPVFVHKTQRATIAEVAAEAKKEAERLVRAAVCGDTVAVECGWFQGKVFLARANDYFAFFFLSSRTKKKAAAAAARAQETRNMVAEQIRRDEDSAVSQANQAGQDSDSGLPDDDDDLEDPVEFEAWRLREVQRLARDRKERFAFEADKAETERRRGLTEAQRAAEDLAAGKGADDRPKEKWKFMQKYYHKGAFYMDEVPPRPTPHVILSAHSRILHATSPLAPLFCVSFRPILPLRRAWQTTTCGSGRLLSRRSRTSSTRPPCPRSCR